MKSTGNLKNLNWKRCVVIIALLAAALMCGCDKTETPGGTASPAVTPVPAATTGNMESNMIDVDKTKIRISNVNENVEFIEENEQIDYSALMAEHIKNSYSNIQCQSYEDKWYRIFESYSPKFTDEIDFEGADVIKQFFEEKYLAECEYMEWHMSESGIGSILIDSESDYCYYYFGTYSVDYLAPYLVVNHYYALNTGGTHSLHFIVPNNFDMRTGERLELDDLFIDGSDYFSVLGKLLNTRIKELDVLVEEIDLENPVNTWGEKFDLVFRITEDELVFIFNEYTIASYAEGCIEIAIPFEELNGVIKPDIPAKYRQ